MTGEGRAAQEVLKVGATSKPVLVAGAIAGVIRSQSRVEVHAIGAGAVNQARAVVSGVEEAGRRHTTGGPLPVGASAGGRSAVTADQPNLLDAPADQQRRPREEVQASAAEAPER